MSARQAIELSWHALERFQERVYPGLNVDVSAMRLEQLCETAELSFGPPVWLRGPRSDTDAYLTIGVPAACSGHLSARLVGSNDGVGKGRHHFSRAPGEE